MDHSRIRFNRWDDYENAVDEHLKDPETAPWLDKPLDAGWALRSRLEWDKNNAEAKREEADEASDEVCPWIVMTPEPLQEENQVGALECIPYAR